MSCPHTDAGSCSFCYDSLKARVEYLERQALLDMKEITEIGKERDRAREALALWCEAWDLDDSLPGQTLEPYFKAREASEEALAGRTGK